MVQVNSIGYDQIQPQSETVEESYLVRFAEETATNAYRQDELAIAELTQEMMRSRTACSEQYMKIKTIIDRLLVPAVADLNSIHLSYGTQISAYERACRRLGLQAPDADARPDSVDMKGIGERVDQAIFG